MDGYPVVSYLAGLLTYGSPQWLRLPIPLRETVTFCSHNPRIQRRPLSVTDSHRIPYSLQIPMILQHQVDYVIVLCHNPDKSATLYFCI